MKRNLRKMCLLAVLLHATFSLCAKNIWSGSQVIDWGNSGFLSLGASSFSEAQVADRIAFTIQFTGNTDWPQIALNKGDWSGGLSCAGNTPVSAETTVVYYYITTDMLADLQQSGVVVAGVGFTLTSVDIEEGNGGAGYENAVWIGETVLKTDWSTYQSLPASCFKNAAVGKLMRLKFKDLKAGAMALPKTSSWSDMPDAGGKYLDGTYVDYEITTDMLAELKPNGCIIQGVGFTLTGVELIGEDDLSKLVFSVPVTNNWVWDGNNQPTITLNASNPTDKEDSFDVEIIVTTDKRADYYRHQFGTHTLAPGESQAIELTLDTDFLPGFYNCLVMAGGEMVRSFVFGVSPELIVSEPDMQADFAQFWQKAKEELAATDPQYTLTEITSKSSAKRKVYLVEMRSVPDQTGEGILRAYYAEPNDGMAHPAIIHYQGYDGGTYDPWCPGGNDNPDYAELVVATRGQLINNRPPYTNVYGDWFVYGFDHQDHYYYRGAFMDAVRAIDFLCSRDAVQKENIFAEGASQGGALTLAAAALDDRLRAIAPAIPFLGDFPDYFQIASWPGNAAIGAKNKLGMSDEDMYAMLSYFDTKNLATLINCPVRMDFSLQDNTCPPHTNWAPYNNLPANLEKSWRVNPTLGHETPSDWWNDEMDFFKKHTVDLNSVSELQAESVQKDRLFNLQGIAIPEGKQLPRGIYLRNGKKVVVK